MRAQGQDCLESEPATVRLWVGGRVMPEMVQGNIKGADMGEEDIAAVGLDIGTVAVVGEQD